MKASRYMKYGNKPPMTKARRLKKQTEAARRKELARRKVVLASVAAVAQGCAGQIEAAALKELENHSHRRGLYSTIEQMWRICSWSEECLTGLEIGKKALSRAWVNFANVQAMLMKYIHGRLDGIEQYAAVWMMISFMADEARDQYSGQAKEWNFLAGCIATWCVWLLEECDDLEQVEAIGGELSQMAWEVIRCQ
ncbi:hypothetical protein [Desulfonatronovibrio hydrogenovorans]|uniref:hypothetical protein n=1 Tax=Desulfonatronovibrio hydrogenovorans TaxID=53245 RepID=UPI0012375DC8|nr:hypothetical protein [Desulfonatronovibrio hydrogenovorans]